MTVYVEILKITTNMTSLLSLWGLKDTCHVLKNHGLKKKSHSNCTITKKVIGKRINWGAGYVVEIPVQHMFIGTKKVANYAGKKLKTVVGSLQKRTMNWTK